MDTSDENYIFTVNTELKLLQMKKVLLLLLLFIAAGFAIPGNNVDGLTVEFKSITDDTIAFTDKKITMGYKVGERIYTGTEVTAHKGMKFLGIRVVFKNEGVKNCEFNLKDIYLSTEQDSLYQFVTLQGWHDDNTKIKPNKKISRTLIFEFPEKAIPKELFIEDKRYKVALTIK